MCEWPHIWQGGTLMYRLRRYREIYPYTSLFFAIRPRQQIDGFIDIYQKDQYVKGPLFWLKTISQ